jgi:hypothetical protein
MEALLKRNCEQKREQHLHPWESDAQLIEQLD